MQRQNIVFALILFAAGFGTALATDVPYGDPDFLPGPATINHPVRYADLDGDGDLDIVHNTSPSSGLVWVENSGGSPDFWAVREIGDSWAAQGIADMDGDGDLDIVARNVSFFAPGAPIVWFDNNGASPPVWTTRVVAPVGLDPNPSTVEIADLNGDGHLDLLVPEWTQYTSFPTASDLGEVVWYENSGAPTPGWTRRIIYEELSQQKRGYETSIAADVDGDGDLDVVAKVKRPNTGPTSNEAPVQWFRNNGGSPLSWDPTPLEIGILIGAQSGIQLSAGDLDGDGDIDVVTSQFHEVVGTGGGSGMSWFESDGTATPVWTPYDVVPRGGGATWVHGESKLVDLDQDGDTDIVVSGDGGGTGGSYLFYENDGASPPGWIQNFLASGLSNTRQVDLGDVDRDGDLDVLGASTNVVLLENRTIHRSAVFPEMTTLTSFSAPFADKPFATGDVDGDGDLDIALGDRNSTNRLFLNNGTSDPFNGVVGSDITADGQPTSHVVLADFDRDGDLDFVAGNSGDPSRLYLNNGTTDPFFGVVGTDIPGGATLTDSMGAADMDGDGDLDLVMGRCCNLSLRVIPNNGTAAPFNGVTPLPYASVDTKTLAIADLDGDGDLDLVQAGAEIRGSRVRYNNGTADPFAGSPEIQLGTDLSTQIRLCDTGDVDGDGDVDVVVSGTSGTIYLFENNGTADPFNGVSETPIALSDIRTAFVKLGDLDADGDLDIFRSGYLTRPEVLFNNGSATPFQNVSPVDIGAAPVSPDPRALDIADMDGDGKPDLVSTFLVGAGGVSPGLQLLLNRGGQFANPAADCATGAIREGEEELLASVDLELNARPGDSPGRVASTAFDLGQEPAALSAIIDTLRLYRDDGNGEFDDADVLLPTSTIDVASFVGGAGGIYEIEYPVDDPNGIVAAPARFFLTGQVTSSASGMLPLQVSTSTGSTLVTDANAGIALTQEDDGGLGVSCLEARPIVSTLVVNDTADGGDAIPGDGICATAGGFCTLRAAIMEANASPGADNISLSAGTYQLTIAGNDDTGLAGDLDITGDLTIAGAGADVTIIDAGPLSIADRVFDVLVGTVEINDLTATGGVGSGGGGIRLSSSGPLTLNRCVIRDNSSTALGGGIYADSGSDLRLVETRIVGNTATNYGGGIHSRETANVQWSEISGNSAGNGGGGIYSDGDRLDVLASTISGNDAGNEGGGGVYVEGILVAIEQSTITQNVASAAAGGIAAFANTVTLTNTILWDNTGGSGDCTGDVESNGYNIIESSGGCSVTLGLNPGPDLNMDPTLSSLSDYGGPTLTHRLLAGSPAIDAGSCGNTTDRDQTGQLRPIDELSTPNVDDGCDIGAYEARVGQTQTSIEIPIRWCGVSGAPSIEDPSLVGQTTVNDVLRRRHEVASDDIYSPQAGIVLRSAGNFIIEDYPILAAPPPICVEVSPGVEECDVRLPGDVMLDLNSGDFSEFQDLVAACRAAWQALDPKIHGITAVHINRFVDRDGFALDILGVGGRAPFGDAVQQVIAGRVMVVDNFYRINASPPDLNDRLFGHEMGHALSLRHGNGIDDNLDLLLDNNDDRPLPRFDGPNLLQYRNGDELSPLQALQMRIQALVAIPDAGLQPFSDSIADGTPIDEEQDEILEFGFKELLELEQDEILEFEQDEILEFEQDEVLEWEQDEVLEWEQDEVLEWEQDEVLEWEQDEILEFGATFTGNEPTETTTFHISLAELPWPASVRPDTRYYFYLDLDTNDATGGYPADYMIPGDAANFPGLSNLDGDVPIGDEFGVDIILEVTLTSDCPGGVCSSFADLQVFDFNDTAQDYDLVATGDLSLTAFGLGLYRETGGVEPEYDDIPVGITIRVTLDNAFLFAAGWGFEIGPNGPVPNTIGMEAASTVECSGRVLNTDPGSAFVDCQCNDCGDCPDYPGCEDGVGPPRTLTDSRITVDSESGELTFEPPVLPRAVAAPVLAQEGQTITVYVFDLPTDVTGLVEVTLDGEVLGTISTSAIDASGEVSVPVTLPVGKIGERTLSSGIQGFAPRAITVVTIVSALSSPNNDGDGEDDATDEDDDNDGVSDVDETANGSDPLNPFNCGDSDLDTCDDCNSGSLAPLDDGPDFDLDGLCNAGDPDDDKDGVLDVIDGEPFNPDACGDSDGDLCDDCAVVSNVPSPFNDGPDADSDGLCDRGDLFLTTPLVGAIVGAPVDPKPIGTTISVSASFTDANPLDTHSAAWDWGDGFGTPGTVNESGGSGTVTDDHTYTQPGVYRIRLTVTDGMETGESVFQYVVIYDPSIGFVTGGGWVDSPAGAYASDPAATGQAHFAFVAKYRRKQSVPTGNTHFDVADMNFKSTSYDWLVISQFRARLQGSGTINGTGDYGFLLSVIDEKYTSSLDDDLFRAKIWDKNAGDAVVYDNLMGEDEIADPTTPLSGGSIVIHLGKLACGNGKVNWGQSCDDGNFDAGDGCSPTCKFEICGSGEINPDEVCDDGNTIDGDGCSADCLSDESCGNGIVDVAEECDDANVIDDDGCANDCTIPPFCGDGTIDPGETCEPPGSPAGASGNSCRNDCTVCGDGIVDTGEQCDDGNNIDYLEDGVFDECLNDCTYTPG